MDNDERELERLRDYGRRAEIERVERLKFRRSGRKLDELSIASYQLLSKFLPSQIDSIKKFISNFSDFNNKKIVFQKDFIDFQEYNKIDFLSNFNLLCEEITQYKYDYLIIPNIHYAVDNIRDWTNLYKILLKYNVILILDYKKFAYISSANFINLMYLNLRNLEKELKIENSIEFILEQSNDWLSYEDFEDLNKPQMFIVMQNQFEIFLNDEIDKKEYLNRVSQLMDLYQYFNR